MRKTRFLAFFFSLLALFFVAASFPISKVSAAVDAGTGGNPCQTGANGLNLGSCLLLGNGFSVGQIYKTPADLINVIVTNIYILAGIILFVMVIYSGFLFISG